jgi:hypothetical protein
MLPLFYTYLHKDATQQSMRLVSFYQGKEMSRPYGRAMAARFLTAWRNPGTYVHSGIHTCAHLAST